MGKIGFAGGKVGMEGPVGGLKLADIAEGSIVKLNENGSPAEFLVVKHDYESGLNGVGRTLLLRKDYYTRYKWSNTGYNDYANSAADQWLNGTYKPLLDASVQAAIGTIKFYYTIGNGDKTVSAMNRSVLLLSVTEYGFTDNAANVEGTALPVAQANRIAPSGSHHTRSPQITSGVNRFSVASSGGYTYGSGAIADGMRPAFTLPETAYFDAETLHFRGVA